MRSLWNRILFDWLVWRTKQKLMRACPELREIEARERAAKKAHKPIRSIHAERARVVHAELARELGVAR